MGNNCTTFQIGTGTVKAPIYTRFSLLLPNLISALTLIHFVLLWTNLSLE